MLPKPYEVPIGGVVLAVLMLALLLFIAIQLLSVGRKRERKQNRRDVPEQAWPAMLRPETRPPTPPATEHKTLEQPRDALYQYIVSTARLHGLTHDGGSVFVPVRGGIHADLIRGVNTRPGQHSDGWMVRYTNHVDLVVAKVSSGEDLMKIPRTRYHDWS